MRDGNNFKVFKDVSLNSGPGSGPALSKCCEVSRERSATGVPRSQETAPPQDPRVGLCLGPYGGPKEVGVSYKRGTPVGALGEAVEASPGPLPSGEQLKMLQGLLRENNLKGLRTFIWKLRPCLSYVCHIRSTVDVVCNPTLIGVGLQPHDRLQQSSDRLLEGAVGSWGTPGSSHSPRSRLFRGTGASSPHNLLRGLCELPNADGLPPANEPTPPCWLSAQLMPISRKPQELFAHTGGVGVSQRGA